MSKKYYFTELDGDKCYSIEGIKYFMEENGLDEIEVYLAKPMIGEDFFYCNHFEEVGLVGEGCGIQCEAYSPRNGKNGRCRFSGHCYEPTDEKRTIKIKV